MYELDKDKLERVQRRATKNIKTLKDRTYNQRIEALQLPTLEYRRRRGDLIQAYKILHNIDNVQENFLPLSKLSSTRGHSLKLEKRHCTSRIRKNFFSFRVVDSWNSLTEDAVTSKTVNGFKNSIENIPFCDKYLYEKW